MAGIQTNSALSKKTQQHNAAKGEEEKEALQSVRSQSALSLAASRFCWHAVTMLLK